MLKLDDAFLVSLGLGAMPTEEKEAFLRYVYDELQLRISTELSEKLSDDQLGEFEDLVDVGDRDKVLKWLEENCPNYQEVAQRHLERLRQEIITGKDQILASR